MQGEAPSMKGKTCYVWCLQRLDAKYVTLADRMRSGRRISRNLFIRSATRGGSHWQMQVHRITALVAQM